MIKLGYLVSYDYVYLFDSLLVSYDYVDKIFLAIDRNRITWVGNTFELPNSFFKKIEELDVNSKITIYEDDFFVANLTPMENEVRERNMLLKKMGKGWLIQLDSDEYIHNFKDLANQLNKKKYITYFSNILPVVLSGYWLVLFKKSNNGFFTISNKEKFNFITNYPKFTSARYNHNFTNINIGGVTFHQAYAREQYEIHQKINNWGHKNDFDTNAFFEFWKSININNYERIKNFHPIKPKIWSSLEFIEGKSIKELIDNYEGEIEFDFANVKLIKIFWNNMDIKFARFKRRMKSLYKKIRNIKKIKKRYKLGVRYLTNPFHIEGNESSLLELRKKPLRYDIINFMLSKYSKNTTYLEIGVRNPNDNYIKIKATKKYGVDPGIENKENPVDFKMTSDEFFDKLKKDKIFSEPITFDVIFIDGLHLAKQVKRDLENSLEFLSDDGFIVLHDCNPPTSFHARENYYYRLGPAGSYWNGTTWKAFFDFRKRKDYYSCCIDADWGVGIISKKYNLGKPTAVKNHYYEYDILEKNRNESLNLISFEEFKMRINNI